ncbi:MAG: 3-isopropylmalate dehydratase, partial [Candidatus Aureabacteria bacterium]|nr:3-isopropylmalate dehydratase [Candidatus Auribacterota bacterium]
AINVGLPVIMCDTDKIKEGDKLEVDLSTGIVKNVTSNLELKFPPLPDAMRKILEDGGLVKHIKKHGDLKI